MNPVVSRFVMKAKAVKNQSYKALVVVNAPSEIRDATEKGKPLTAFNEGIMKLNFSDYANPSPVELTGINEKNFFMSNFKGAITVLPNHLYKTSDLAEQYPVLILVDRAVAKITLNTQNLTVSNNAVVENIRWKADIINRTTYWVRRWAMTAHKTEETINDLDREYIY
ncbi:MAG: hypothetical protein LUE93_16400, partial [Bacteroides sp.]|nr:hypothetical protein [Bacteroides sp.]